MKNRTVSKSMKLVLIAVAAAISLPAGAKVIADFQADFNPENPETGWSYQWNPTGVELGATEKYAELDALKWGVRVNRNIKQADEALGDGQWLVIKDEGKTWSPGLSAGKSSDEHAHHVIAVYTVQPGEAGFGSIKASTAKQTKGIGTGHILVYVNDTLIKTTALDTDGGQSFDTALGSLKEGDVVYVAFGCPERQGISAFIQYRIETEPVPEKPIVLG